MANLPKEVLAACKLHGVKPETLQSWKIYPAHVVIVVENFAKITVDLAGLDLEEKSSEPEPEAPPKPAKRPERVKTIKE